MFRPKELGTYAQEGDKMRPWPYWCRLTYVVLSLPEGPESRDYCMMWLKRAEATPIHHLYCKRGKKMAPFVLPGGLTTVKLR